MDNIPVNVTFGVRREGLDTFDDLSELQKHPGPYKIKEIEVQYNDQHILGTEFTYVAADGHKHTGHNITHFKPFGTLFGHVHKQTFHIADDDELAEISGHAGLRINELHFKTYKGHEARYGHPNGEHFKFSWQGHTFGAVSGGFGEHLDYLEVRVNPLPEHHRHLVIVVTH